MAYNRYHYSGSGRGNSSGLGIPSLLLMIIAMIVLISVTKGCNRADAHMVYIEDGYCYHEDTHIIYIESETDRYGTHTSYTPYYDPMGCLNIYDAETGNWIPVYTEGSKVLTTE